MGLSIGYSGKFNQKASLAAMIDEVAEIAKTYNWKYNIYETSFPESGFDKEYSDKIYGIDFSPTKCEPVFLCFLSNGRMSSGPYLRIFGNSQNKDYQKYLYLLSTKTQFAGVQVHKLIVHILKHISKKYIKYFKVFDEGHYWETLDDNILKERFALYNELLDTVCDSLQNFPTLPGESIESYFDRLILYISEKRKKKK